MTQELKFENPLGMYDGCWAKQRDGKIVGPWTWGAPEGRLYGWYCNGHHRFNNGKHVIDALSCDRDLIAVVAAPLPEPIERWAAIGPNRTWITGCDSATQARRIAGETDFKVYRVRIEFLEEVTL